MSQDEPMIGIVKPMRDLVYRLQTKLHRPTNKIPEDFKKSTLKQVGNILTWSFDTAYISPDDIRAGVEKYTVFVNEKLKELEEVEAQVKAESEGLCLASAANGTYVVQKRVDPVEQPERAEARTWKESNAAGTISSIVFCERKGRCAQMGLTDGDIPTLLECATAGGDFNDIEELDLRENELMDGGLQRLVIGLSAPSLLPKLNLLRIGGNQYGPLGLEVVAGLRLFRKHVTVDEHWDGSVDIQTSSAVNESSSAHEDGGATVGYEEAPCKRGSGARKESSCTDYVDVRDAEAPEAPTANVDKHCADTQQHDASTDASVDNHHACAQEHHANAETPLDMLD
eukprot:GEMP01036624.1.p1 GENE.GEMP01036624.1~~GEMP01036624.1.p1  ORF type:complete len:341 (+),score=101.98 GEMP01036624.1:56-1078(+)